MPDESLTPDPRYHARDWLLAPTLVSLLRVPLALVFPWVSHQPRLALAILIGGAATDVLDGYLARHLKQATALGAVLDGVVDKLFAATIAGTLLWQRQLSLSEASLLFVRELMELPLVLWWAADRAQRQHKLRRPRANWLGKLATVIQFISLAAILSSSRSSSSLIGITAICGALAAASYWGRELDASRAARA